MALCGAGCMGFVNVAHGLRATGYLEPDPLPGGPVALVTHSGSVFSAMLRARRGFGFTLAVSSGQELVTTAADYARYALRQPETRVLALVLEAIRDGAGLRSVLADAAGRDVPVVLLTAGASARAGRWSPPTPARWPPPTAPGRHWPTPTACTASTTWPSWPTPWNCSRWPAGPRPAAPPRASPPCTTPAWSGPTWPTWPPSLEVPFAP